MAMGRNMRLGLGIGGVAGLAIAAALAVWMAPREDADTRKNAAPSTTPAATSAVEAEAPAPDSRAGRLAIGDRRALVEAERHLAVAESEGDEAAPQTPSRPLSDREADAWIDDIAGLAAGFDRFGPVGRARAVAIVGEGLRRLGVDPAPNRWPGALEPSAEVVLKALGDPSPRVRADAGVLTGRLWEWLPGGSAPTPEQERSLASFKQRLHGPVVRLLEDREPGVRLAAVQSLGRLPIDSKAAPALSRLDDPVAPIRMQLLTSFALRRDLLTDDDVLPRLFDDEALVRVAAQALLKARGLSDSQIELGRLLVHPRTAIRLEAATMIEGRDDIDADLWLIRLSHDLEESVRSSALEALARRDSPDSQARVAEMADDDPAPSLREAASRIVARRTATADLPPLPGAPVLR